MKIKNLAFYGVMAAILGSVGTARADDSTIIASKGYVDAYAQKQSDRYQGTWSGATTTQKSSTDLYPSMHTLEDAVGNGVTGAINNLDLAEVSDTGKPIVAVSQTDGQVAADVGQITTAGINDTALAKSGTGNNNLGTAGSAVDTKLPTEKAVADALALKEDSSNKQAAQTGATVTRWDTTAAEGTDAYTSDTKFPTVKAVAQQIAEIDVSAAVDDGDGSQTAVQLTSDDDTAPSTRSVIAMADNSQAITRDTNTGVVSINNTGDGYHFATTKSVAGSFSSLTGQKADSSTGESAGAAADATKRGQPVVKVTQTNGQVTAELGQIGTAGVNFIANQGTYAKGWNDSSVTTASDSTNNSNLGTGKGSKDTYVPTMLAVEKYVADNTITPNTAITASGNNDHSIVTYDENGLVTNGVSLPGLNDINTDADAACTKGAPCVLSYYVDGTNRYYKWTSMDTEGLNAVNDTTPSATTGA